MRSMGNRTVRSLLVAAAAFALPGAMTFSARAAEPESASVSPARALDRAAELASAGKLIQARNMIDTVLTSQRATLSDEEHRRVFSLIGQIEMGLRGLSATEVNLQKAEAALIVGDLRSAEAHANSVIVSKVSSESEKVSARAIERMVQERRADLTPRIKMDLSTAVDDFAAGNYARAKMKLDGVMMSGVELSAGERGLLEEYRGKLSDMAAATGDMSLGSFPAMDEKTDWLLQEGQPAGQPQSQPTTDPIQESQRNEAMRILAEADQAFRDGRYAEAQTKYNRLLSQFGGFLSAEDLDHVEQQATSAALQLGRQPGANVLGETQQSLDLIRERARALFASQMEQLKASLASGDFSAAALSGGEARLTAQRHRNVLPEEEYQGMLDEAAQWLSQVEQARSSAEIAERERIERELAALQSLRDDEQRAERQRLINENISRVRALQLEQKYDEALQVVDQILALDPLNPAGLLLRDVLEDTKIYRTYYTIQRDKALSYAHQTNQNEEALIAPETIIGYPSDWPQISFKRGEPMQFSESAVNRAVLATMQEKRIPVNFSDHAFGDVLQFYEQVSGLNMDIDWESLELIGVDRESPVTLNLTNVTLETVLDRVLAKVSDPDIPAGWAVNDGILTIASDEVLRRNTLLEIYDIRDLLIDIPDYTNAPQFDLNSAFQNSGGGRGGGGGGGGRSPFQQTGQGPGQQQGERRTREEMIDEIVDIITSNVDYDGWQENGGETGSIREFNGNLIISNTPRNHRAIIGLLRKLREVRALQISVEARFLLVSQDYFEQIGFDLDVYFNADNNEFQIARTLDPSLLPSDYFDPETGRLRRRVGSGNFDLDGDGTIGPVGDQGEDGDFVPVFSPGTQGDDWSLISGSQNSFDLTNLLSQGSTFASQILGAAPALGVSGQFLDDIQVDFLIEATQADRRSVSLNAPRLTFTNGQTANIFVTSQRAYVSDLEPVTSQGSVAFDPVIDVINDGVTLLVDGVVSADRRYVTLNVVANVSQLVDLLPYETTGGAAGGGGLGGGDAATAQGVIQQPIVAVTGVSTTVTVPDQGTIMLGGQRLVSELQVETGVPVLSKIPILSRFFSNRVDSKEEQTLLILIKPTILIQNEQEEDNFPGLLDALGG